MRGGEFGWEILVGGDLSPLAKAIADVEKTLDGLGETTIKEMEKVEEAAKVSAQGVGKLGTEAVEALAKAGVAADRLSGAVLGADGRVRDAKGRFVALGTEGEAALKKLTGAAEKAGHAVSEVPAQATTGFGRVRAGLTQLEGSLKGFQEKHEKALGALGPVSLAAGGAFAGLAIEVGVAAKAFGDFEATLNQIQAVADVTGKDMDAMRAQALQLGADTQFSAKEAAEGMSELAKAGFTAQQTMAAIPGVMSLAAAGGVSVADAAELAGGAIRGFNLAASDAQRVADLMAQTANKSAVDIADLQLTMKYVAPVASSAGQSIEEMSTAIAIMGNNMIKGEQAGTTLRGALVRLVDPPKDAADALSKLKIAITDTHGKMLPLSDIIAQLREKTAKMTEVQRSAALSAIFGTEALSGMMALVKEAPASYDEMGRSMKAVDGVSQQMAQTMNKGLKGSLEQMQGSIDTLNITLGEQFAPAIVAAAGGVQQIANVFTNMDPATKMLIAGLGAGALAFTGLTVAAGALGLALPVVTAGVELLGLTIGTAVPIVGAISLAVGAATVAAKLYADTVDAENKQQAEANKTRAEAAERAIAHKTALEKLVKEHDNLASKAHLSKEEESRLHEILGKIRDLSPDLAGELDKVNTAHWGSVDAVRAYTGELDAAIAKQRKVLEGQVAIAQLAFDKKRLDVDTEQKVNARKKATTLGNERVSQDLTRSDVPLPMAIPKPSELKEMLGEVGTLDTSDEAKKLEAAKKALSNFNARAAGKDTTTHVDRGAAYSGGGGKKHKAPKGKDPAKEAAAKLKAFQKDALGALEDKYGEAMLQNEDGDAGEAEIKRAYIVDLRLSGLDRTEAGFKKVRELAGDLRKYTQKQQAEGEAIAQEFANDDRERNAKTAAENYKANHDAQKNLADMETQIRKERAAAAKSAELDEMGYFQRRRAEVKATFEEERKEANKVYLERLDQIAKNQAAREAIIGPDAAWVEAENARRDADAARQATLADISNREKKAASDIAKEWVGAAGEIRDAFSGLAADPSLDNFAKFAQNLVNDPDKLKKWASTAQDAWTEMQKIPDVIGKINLGALDLGSVFSGAADGLGALIEEFGPLMAVAGTIAMWGVQFMAVKGALDAVNKPAEQLKATMKGLNAELADIGSNLQAGLITESEATSQQVKALRDHLAELQGQMKDLKASMDDRGILRFMNIMFNPWNFLGMGDLMNKASLDQAIKSVQDQVNTLDPHRNRKEQVAEDLTGIDIRQGNGLLSSDDAAKAKADTLKQALEDALKEQREAYLRGDNLTSEALGREAGEYTKQLEPLQKQIDAREAILDLTTKIADAEDKAKAARDELNQGGVDDWGHKITLEQEKQNKLNQQAKADADKLNKLTEQQVKLQEQLKKLNEDEAKAIADIENEGIAQRQDSEALYKAKKIADVQKDYAQKRSDLTKEISDNEQAITDANLEAEQAASRINAQYAERISKLSDELTTQQGITDQLKQQLFLKQQIVGSAGGASYAPAVNSSGQVDGSKVTVGTRAANMSGDGSFLEWDGHAWNRVPHAANGGEVVGGIPGKDSVMVKTMPGEVIANVPLVQDLKAMAAVFKRGGLVSPAASHLGGTQVTNMGGFSMGDLVIHVPAGANLRAEDVGPLAWAYINGKARRSGLGRR